MGFVPLPFMLAIRRLGWEWGWVWHNELNQMGGDEGEIWTLEAVGGTPISGLRVWGHASVSGIKAE